MNKRKRPTENGSIAAPRERLTLTSSLLIRVAPAVIAASLCLAHHFEPAIASEPVQRTSKPGPILHYTFDDGRAQTVKNEVGNKHTGRRVRALFQSSGAVGRALVVWKDRPQFGYVETPDHKDLNSPKFTVAAWIKLRQKDSNGSVVCKHAWPDGKSRGFVLRCYTAEHINFTIGANGWKSTDGMTRIPAKQWVHVAGTFDGKHIRVYCNGQQEGVNEIKEPYTPSTRALRIGHAAFVLERNGSLTVRSMTLCSGIEL